ncbi:hypothetical protein ABBQ38_009531 [Trebouxia sp. C0009 RCD-2024]
MPRPASPGPDVLLGEASRPPHVWLEDLQRAKAEAFKGQRVKITISDIVDRANDPKAGSLEPTSPRSVEACLRLGIEPSELRYISSDAFLHLEHGDKELADIAYNHCETVRQERLAALVEERKQVIEDEEHGGKKRGKGEKGGAGLQVDAEDMVQKEAQRLEVMKRRQERELGQMVAYEVMRKEMQDKAEAKLRTLEVKAQEQQKARLAADEEWRRQQRERELARLHEEEEREREMKQLEVARYQQEMKLAQKEAEEEKIRRKQAYLKEQERIAKGEAARRETERILREQQAEVDAKKTDMVKRDIQREKLKHKQAEEAAARDAEASAKAEARIKAALEANRSILLKRRQDFDTKQAENEERRKQKEAERRREDALKREREAQKRIQRKQAYQQAQQREEERVNDIVHRTVEKDEKLATLRDHRDHANACKSLERKLDLDLKREKVEAGKRRDMYQRNQLLHKIQDETEKARSLLDARAQLQQQRKMANMGASFQRQKLLQAMEKLQTSKDWAKNGTVNMDSLLKANH